MRQETKNELAALLVVVLLCACGIAAGLNRMAQDSYCSALEMNAALSNGYEQSEISEWPRALTNDWPEAATQHEEARLDRARAILGIALQESGNRKIGIHRDGMSYGRMGVTFVAVRYLWQHGLVGNKEYKSICKNRMLIASDSENIRYAGLYLDAMQRLSGDATGEYCRAVGKYHGGKLCCQAAYRKQVLAKLAENEKSEVE